jgi:hypothetical protein
MIQGLERLTAAALILVVAVLGWMVLAAFRPEFAQFASEETEILAVLGLLGATLCLVSLLALIHTRRH